MKRKEAFDGRIRRMAAVTGLALILSLNLAGSAGGQKSAEFELSALRGTGTGELGQRIGRAGWGGSIFGGRPLPGTPFSLGVRLALVNYGSEHNADLAGYSAAVPAGVKDNHNPFMVGDAIFIMDQNDSMTVLSSVAPSVGLGGGLMFRLARFGPGRKGAGA